MVRGPPRAARGVKAPGERTPGVYQARHVRITAATVIAVRRVRSASLASTDGIQREFTFIWITASVISEVGSNDALCNYIRANIETRIQFAFTVNAVRLKLSVGN